ncbi:MAG TPA: hypothetical protein PLY23_00690 [Alphaproteobacteria bacterium]|nr:hypothetical protein [Alphaproteobacteria bacterium]HQS93182.1 hypothetical protein [Alphaproteobacteria bacterium]
MCGAMEETHEGATPPASIAASPPAPLAEGREEKGNLEALFPFLQTQSHRTVSPREIFYGALNCNGDQVQELPLPSFSILAIKGINVFEPHEQDFKKLGEESLRITNEAKKNGSFFGSLRDLINFYGSNFSEQSLSLSSERTSPYHHFPISHITRCFEIPDFQRNEASLKSFLERGTCFAQKQDIILKGLLPNGHKIEIHVETKTEFPFSGKIQGVSYIGIPEMSEVSVYFHVHFPEVQALQFIKASKSIITSWPDPTPFSDWVYWEGSKMTGVEPKMQNFNRTFYDKRWWENWTQYSEILDKTLNLSSSLRQFAEVFQPALKKNPNRTIGEALLEAPTPGFYETLFKMPLDSSYIYYSGPESSGKILRAEGSQRWMRRAETEEFFSTPVLNVTPEEINFLNCLIPKDLPPDMYSCNVQRPSPSAEEEHGAHSFLGNLSLIWTGRNGTSYNIRKRDHNKPYRIEVFRSGNLQTLPPFFKQIEEEESRYYALLKKQERLIIEKEDEDEEEDVTGLVLDTDVAPPPGARGAAAAENPPPSVEQQERTRFIEMLNRQERGNAFNESHIFYHEAPDVGSGVPSVSDVVPEYKILEINREEWKTGKRTQSSAADKKKEEEKEKKINLWENRSLQNVKEAPWNLIQSLVTETGHYFAQSDPSPQFTLSLISGSRSPLEEVFTLKKHRWVESRSKTSLEKSLEEGLCEITSHVTIFSGSLSDQRTCSLLIETSHQDALMAKIKGIFYVTNPFTKEISVYFHAEASFLGGTYFVHASQTLPIKIENTSQLLPDWIYWEGNRLYEVGYKNPTFAYDINWWQNWVLEDRDVNQFLLRFYDSLLKGKKTKGRVFGISPDERPKDKDGLYKILRNSRFSSNIVHTENHQLRTVKTSPSSLRPKYSLDQVHTLICMKGNSKITPLNFEIPEDLPSGFYEIIHAAANPYMTWKSLRAEPAEKTTGASASADELDPVGSPESGIRRIEKTDQNEPFGFKMSYEEDLSLDSQVQETLKEAQYTPFLTELHIIGAPHVLEHLEVLKQLRAPLSDFSFKDCGLKGDLPADFFEFIEGLNSLKRFDFSGNPISEDSFKLLIRALSSSTLQELSINAPRKKSSAKKRGAAGAFGGATSGAAAGFVVAGPVGAAAGGLIGAIAGGISGAKASDARAFAKRDKKSDFTVKTFEDIVRTWGDLRKLSIHNVNRSETGCVKTNQALLNVRLQALYRTPLEIQVLPKKVIEEKALTLKPLEEKASDDDIGDWENVEKEGEDVNPSSEDDE